MHKDKNTLIEIVKGLLGIALLLLLFQASKYFFFALGGAFAFLEHTIGNPLILIAIGVIFIILFAVLAGLGKATGETFGADKVKHVVKTILGKKSQ